MEMLVMFTIDVGWKNSFQILERMALSDAPRRAAALKIDLAKTLSPYPITVTWHEEK